MATWKTQNVLDQEAANAECVKNEIAQTCDVLAVDQQTGVMGAEALPFDNPTGQSSVPVDFGGSAELRDGSVDHPFQLTALQKGQGGKFKYIVIAKEDGTFIRVKPPKDDCADYKIVADKDGYRFEKDTTVNEFDPDDLYTTDKPDFVLGGKVVENECGEQVMRLAIYDISDLLDYLDVTC